MIQSDAKQAHCSFGCGKRERGEGMTDRERFAAACQAQRAAARAGGIGTLGEKTLHACIKHYFEPDPLCHETRLGRYVADVVNASGIIEIQTRNFYALRGKLAAFLEQGPVTVVYPVAQLKWLRWVDVETGEVTERRKSPKRGRAGEVLPELYGILPLLHHPGLRVCVLLTELEEYRRLDGWSADKKRGSARYERIPTELAGEVWLRGPADYAALLPEGLAERFTAAELGWALRLRGRRAWQALQVLCRMGTVERVGQRGRAFEYVRTQPQPYA